MVGDPWSVLLATALVPVVVWCSLELLRSARPGRPTPVPVDVVAWHGVMGVAMLVGLGWSMSVDWDRAWAVLFAAAVAWCAFRVSTLGTLGHHARLAVMSVAMVVMIMPMGAADAAAPGSSGQMTDRGDGALVVAVALGLTAAAALRVAARRGGTRSRVSACCEAVMAGVMAVVAVGLH